MVVAICGAIVAIISVIVGLWKYYGRKNSYKREMADAAKQMLDKGLETNDPSLIISAFDRINRLLKK